MEQKEQKNLIEEKIEGLLEQLTLEEKVGMIHGCGLFCTKGVERLGIPPLTMSDGPMGVRNDFENDTWKVIGNTDDYVTYLPSNSAIASSWNRETAGSCGSVLGAEARGRGKDVILASLTGVISDTDIDVIRQLREEIELAKMHKAECQSKMDAICLQYFPNQLKNLQTIPGIKGRSATAIIAEVGTDVSSFQDAAHLVSWCGLKPRNEESAGKIKARCITHGNRYLRKTLIECAWAASKTQGCFFNKFCYHQTVVRRKSKMKVQVAIARKILSAVWYVLHSNVPYRDYSPSLTDIAAAVD